jgi:succinoglycan biosynthesis transport protein ExoP
MNAVSIIEQRPAAEAGTSSLVLHYLNVARRRRWWIAGAVGAALLLGLIATLLMTRQYTATTTLEIARDAQRVVKIEGVEGDSNAGDLEFYQTQYGLLRARSLAETVARDLRLDQDPKFFALFKKDMPGTEGGLFAPAKPGGVSPALRDERTRLAGEILLKHVNVVPERLSRLVAVTFTSPDPQLSARVANAWSKHFINANLERRFDAAAYARRFLESRLEQLRGKLEQSERLLVNYASQERIINIPSSTTAGGGGPQQTVERSLVADDLASLNAALVAAQADVIRARSRVSDGAPAESLSNVAINELRKRRAEAQAEYQKLLTQFEPGYPAARALASQIAQLDRSLAREESRIRGSISDEYRGAQQRANELQARVNALKSGFLDQRRRSIQYNIYQREVDTNRQLYDGLLQRYKEIGVAGGIGTNNVSVVDVAEVPDRPSTPRLGLNLALALVAGLALGVLIALALEQMDDTIGEPADVTSRLNRPLLGTIPKDMSADPVLLLADRKSAMTEAYLSVQTSLEFTTNHGAPRTLAVTSTRPAEGKSTTAYALALTLARSTNRRVILVDADMRSPSVHHLFQMPNDKGLSNFLAGEENVQNLIITGGPADLSVMAAGPPPPNAAELLSGDRFATLVAQLSDRFDHVVIDAPPVMGLADAPLLASDLEAIVFAVESHGMRASLVNVALNRLAAAQANIVGVVLTKFESDRAFGYNYDYGYGYGSDRKSEPRDG